jgi:hypothetical protein
LALLQNGRVYGDIRAAVAETKDQFDRAQAGIVLTQMQVAGVIAWGEDERGEWCELAPK